MTPPLYDFRILPAEYLASTGEKSSRQTIVTIERAQTGHSTADVLAMLGDMGLGREIDDARRELADYEVQSLGRETLRTLRLKRLMTQRNLADILHTSQPRISKLEAGREEMGLKFAEKYAAALGIDLNALAQAARSNEE